MIRGIAEDLKMSQQASECCQCQAHSSRCRHVASLRILGASAVSSTASSDSVNSDEISKILSGSQNDQSAPKWARKKFRVRIDGSWHLDCQTNTWYARSRRRTRLWVLSFDMCRTLIAPSFEPLNCFNGFGVQRTSQRAMTSFSVFCDGP